MLVCYDPARLLALVAEWLSEQHVADRVDGVHDFGRWGCSRPRGWRPPTVVIVCSLVRA